MMVCYVQFAVLDLFIIESFKKKGYCVLGDGLLPSGENAYCVGSNRKSRDCD
jgi:hypothetical protein